MLAIQTICNGRLPWDAIGEVPLRTRAVLFSATKADLKEWRNERITDIEQTDNAFNIIYIMRTKIKETEICGLSLIPMSDT